MKCEIQKIIIHNFKSFADQSFDFSAKPGITTIVGVNNDIPGAANAAGKSSLFSALFYVLFGKDAIKTKNKFLKNRYVKSNEFYVQLYLTIDGKQFKIDRGSTSNNSYLKLFELDSTGNEHEISKSSILETECFLKHILSNLTSDIFLKTVLLSPALGENFFLLTPKEKAEFLNLLSGTNRIYAINEMISKDINGFNTNIKILDNDLMALSKQIDILKQKKNDFLENQKRMKKEHDAQIKKHKLLIESNSSELKLHKEKYDELKKMSDKLREEQESLQKERQQFKMSMVSISSQIKSLEEKNEQFNSFIQKNIGMIERLCDDCKGKITNYLDIDNIKNSIETNSQKIVEEKKRLEELEKECEVVNNAFDKNKSEQNKCSPELNAEYATTIKLERSIESEKELIKTIRNNSKSVSTTEPFSEMINNASNDLNEKQIKKDQIAKDRQKLALLKFMTSDEIVHKFVISQFAKDINLYVAKYLNVMGVNYTITFDNTLAYTFLTPAGEVSYDTFSSGEKMRLNIALSFAFRKLLFKYLNIDINMLVLDEYVDSALDKLAINGIINLLNELCVENHETNIYVISHRSEVLSEFGGSRLIVKKSNGISEIVEETD